MKMTTEEAFVKVLQRHGIEHAFGIIGSAMMPISDIFPKAGIKFWDCAHEGSGGMMADGYTRATGKMSMMIAQNGPGITNFVTAVKTAYWNHTPLLLVTPQAANKTIGQGGFQEVEQMKLFEDMVAYQEEVRDPSRVAEVLTPCDLPSQALSGPAQINIPRDFWTQVIDIELPRSDRVRSSSGGRTLCRSSGTSVLRQVPSDPERRWCCLVQRRHRSVQRSGRSARRAGLRWLPAQRRLPGQPPAVRRPTGLQRLQSGHGADQRADVVLCLGTRLNPFSTLPGYGIDYWPADAKIIQVDINPDRIGLTKKVTVGIVGDAAKVAEGITAQLADAAGDAGRKDRKHMIATDQICMGARTDLHDTKSRTIRAQTGTCVRVRPSLTGCPHAWHGAPFKRRCRVRRSSRPTSATTAQSATPTRRSTRAASIWHRVCLAHVAMACLRSLARKSAALMFRLSALLATAHSASR